MIKKQKPTGKPAAKKMALAKKPKATRSVKKAKEVSAKLSKKSNTSPKATGGRRKVALITGVTGQDNRPTPETIAFFNHLKQTLRHPWLIGFGVKSHEDFQTYTHYADGVIIGSAFINLLENTPENNRLAACRTFVQNIINSPS